MQKNLDYYKNKELVYRILAILHNLPKSMHGHNILIKIYYVRTHKNVLYYIWI